jgi:3-hydroxybutyrate dehydrogenase
VLTDLVRQQVDRRVSAEGVTRDAATRELLRAKQPMHQFSQAGSIGALVAFLRGDAAETVTGAAITMDGGWVAV